MKKLSLILMLTLIFSAICFIFWQQEVKYTLPTPIPKDYVKVKNGSEIRIKDLLNIKTNLPVFLHFFNPECPCSKFNVPEFNKLVQKFGKKIFFAVIVVNDKKVYQKSEIKARFDFQVPIYFNSNFDKLCGVYSTPQAVLIDNSDKLVYRGNYNKNRYCTDINSNFALMAIDSLLKNKKNNIIDKKATISYGCTLPNCSK